jgi:hypothetical protein
LVRIKPIPADLIVNKFDLKSGIVKLSMKWYPSLRMVECINSLFERYSAQVVTTSNPHYVRSNSTVFIKIKIKFYNFEIFNQSFLFLLHILEWVDGTITIGD